MVGELNKIVLSWQAILLEAKSSAKMKRSTYIPRSIFAPTTAAPRIMIAPARYIQGEGVLAEIGRYLSLIPAQHATILISSGGQRRTGQLLAQSLRVANIDFETQVFDHECSFEAVEATTAAIQSTDQPTDCLIAVGGGKCIDAGKAIAFRLGVPIVVCPTIASTDAPTSAVAVMYSEEGIALGGEFYPNNPALVVVDTQIISAAPAHFLAAGIADALASIYEMRAVIANPQARSVIGGRPPLAVQAMAEAGAEILFRDGVAAMEAVRAGKVTPALENVVEANTLASGIGFESGGLAIVHAIASGLTAVSSIRENSLHGQLVAIGILTQLHYLNEIAEAEKVTTFFNALGLPTHLGDLGLAAADSVAIDAVIDKAMQAPFLQNVGEGVTAVLLREALLKLDRLG